jgi:glycosyltransferase involved in cell wall biosynthesis
MRIAIGVPNELDAPDWNGFRTAFRDLTKALSRHELVIYAPGGGDVMLESGREDPGVLMNQYKNTLALSRDFAGKIGAADRVLAFTSMGLFLDRKFIYYTSTVPYKKVAEIAEHEYPPTGRFRELLEYYRFIASREGENYEKAERIIVLSAKIAELLKECHSVDREKIRYVPRPIPRFIRKKESGRGDLKIIIMPAELRVMKGIRYAIETMKLMKKRVPDAVLVICGRINNYEREYVSSLLKDARGKANIVLAGFPPRDRYLEHLSGADCAFMPFCFDECPISLTECVGSGIPLVTNEYAGYAKDVIDEFGYRARHNDVDDYADGLERMLTDEDFRARKEAGAESVAARFTFERYREALADAIERS